MTPAAFRRIALKFPESVENAHHHHPDFRFRGKIFATLGYPDSGFAMVQLTSDQQINALRSAPHAFRPAAGAWGRNGSTLVLLAAIASGELEPFIRQAYDNAAIKRKARPAAG